MSAARLAGRCGAAVLVVLPLLSAAAQAQQAPPSTEGPLSLQLDVIAKALDIAREQIEPSLGASTYKITRPAIENQPQGDNARRSTN